MNAPIVDDLGLPPLTATTAIVTAPVPVVATADTARLHAIEARYKDRGLVYTYKKREITKREANALISQYRRSLDRICMGKTYAKHMGVSLISVLADLDGPKSNATKRAIKKLRDAHVKAKFGIIKA